MVNGDHTENRSELHRIICIGQMCEVDVKRWPTSPFGYIGRAIRNMGCRRLFRSCLKTLGNRQSGNITTLCHLRFDSRSWSTRSNIHVMLGSWYMQLAAIHNNINEAMCMCLDLGTHFPCDDHTVVVISVCFPKSAIICHYQTKPSTLNCAPVFGQQC